MEFQKNEIVTVRIDDIGNDGEGIGRIDGYALFIKDAVIGDLVKAKITKVKKNYGYARVEKVLKPSSFRVTPPCAFHRQCGGCQIQTMDYGRQLQFKQDKVKNHLVRIGGFSAEDIEKIMEPIAGMENPLHYRNKAQVPVGYHKDGSLAAGFYVGHTHEIVPNTDCLLGPAENKLILDTVLDYMKKNQVTAYRENSGQGLVRHVLIRTGFASGEIMVCFVINGKKLPAETELVQRLTSIPMGRKITSISISVNCERTNVIMGKEIRLLWGNGSIKDSLRILEVISEDRDASQEILKDGNIFQGAPEKGNTSQKMPKDGDIFRMTSETVTFQISPLSFYQVNPKQTEKLYAIALDYAGLTGKETVWDLYCGIGTISLYFARRAKRVYGVEVIPQAIADARENARINGIANAEFYVGKAEEILPEKYEEEGIRADVIVVDPPRKGCDRRCLETMLAMKPDRIVYVSCDSATLARDLQILTEGGYELKRVRAVDQFGMTVGVETVCLLSNRKPDTKVRIDVDLEDYYRIKDAKKNQD